MEESEGYRVSRFQQLYLLCRQPRHMHDRCIRYFFSLPTQEFFRGQGKIKVSELNGSASVFFCVNMYSCHIFW